MKSNQPTRLAVAPMMDRTDRHERYFLRLISRHAMLYTEMVTTGALLRGDAARHLRFDDAEHPVALQLGGAVPDALARCAELAAAWGYDEINLNCGCPSNRVQSGRFGACLMGEPERVARCLTAMARATGRPVTVKHRIGIDDRDDYGELKRFVETVAENSPARVFIVHARKAWLKGLSPRQNRDIPPLRYELVYRLKQDFPELEIHINGAITSHEAAAEHLRHVDGVMVGREVYRNPYWLAGVDRMFYGDRTAVRSRHRVVEDLIPYAMRELAAGTPLNAIARHLPGLFLNRPGARRWRRYLSENACRPGAKASVLRDAAALVTP